MCVCVCVYVQVRVWAGACWRRRSRTGRSKPGGPEAGAGQLAAAATDLKMEARQAKTTTPEAEGGASANDEAGCRLQTAAK